MGKAPVNVIIEVFGEEQREVLPQSPYGKAQVDVEVIPLRLLILPAAIMRTAGRLVGNLRVLKCGRLEVGQSRRRRRRKVEMNGFGGN